MEDFVRCAFDEVRLDWQEYVRTDPSLHRPSELWEGRGDAGKAARVLGWSAEYRMPDVVRAMVEAEKEGLTDSGN